MTKRELKRDLGLVSAVMITVGSVIGSGIFLKPLDVANSLPCSTAVYATWVGLGLVCLCGAFAYAELGAMLPEAGGQYTFIREAWGKPIAFLFGWTFFLGINTGTMSALAVAFTQSLERLTGRDLGATSELLVASAMIVLLALVNHFGVKRGAALQNISTFAKLGSLALLVVAGFLLPEQAVPADGGAAPALTGSGVVAACVAIFWAYEGWHQLPFSAAELENPNRNLPLGLILGVVILVTLYLVVNAVYFHLVPIEEMRTMKNEIDVPTTAISRIFGGAGGTILAAMICVSVFGAANPNMLSASRAFFAMAKDGVAPKSLSTVHRVWQTPVVAIWAQAIWAIVLILLLRKFRDLTNFVVFTSLIFYALTVASVYILRVRRPDAARPHRCFGYPLTPAVFIGAVLFVNAYTLIDPAERRHALIGLGILAAGVPVYLWIRRQPAKPTGEA